MQRGQSQALFSDAQWQDKRQWAQTETQKVASEHQETLFYCEGDRALAQIAKRGHGVSMGIFKSCLGMVLHSVLSVALLEQRGWTRLPPEAPSNLNNSVIFINV